MKREFHGRNKAQDMLKHDDHHRDLDVRSGRDCVHRTVVPQPEKKIALLFPTFPRKI